MRVIRLMYELLEPEDRKGLYYLIPVMLLASFADMVVVAAGASFVTAVTNPNGLVKSAPGRVVGTMFQGDDQVLYALGAFALGATILGNLISLGALRLISLYGTRSGGLLSSRLLSTYLHKPYEFFLVREPASLAARVLVEANGVVGTVLMGMLTVSARVLGGVLIIAGLIAYDPGLSLVLVTVVGAAYTLGYTALREFYRRLGRRRLQLIKECHHITHESLDGVKEVQLYGLAEETGDQFWVVAEELAYLRADFRTVSASMRYLIEVLGIGGIVTVAFYYQMTGQDLAELTPVLAAYGIATVRLLPVFQNFYMTLSKVQLQLPALEGLHEDMQSRRERTPEEMAPPPQVTFESDVRLHEATFVYPNGSSPVFADLDLSIPAGDWVAFVGTTGAGKSTLVDTLLGLLQLQEGELAVDGQALDKHGRRGWQQNIAYVPQHIFIRRASLRENISFAGDLDEEQVWKAVRIADLEAFVTDDLDEGLDSQLGPRGQRLSGGQRQRVGIARAIAQRPKFLVLDEATSALDNETEASVVNALREELPGTTVVMIAHRLSSTRHCDRIFVLERGEIVEQGSYDELAAADGRFATMLAAAE